MSAIPKRLTKFAIAEHQVPAPRECLRRLQDKRLRTARSVLLKALRVAVGEVRTARSILQSWALSKVGRIRGVRLEDAAYSHPVAAERSQRMSFPCPRCRVTLCLKGEGSQAMVYDFTDWEQRCKHSHFGSPQLCQMLSGQSDFVH